MPKRRPNPVHLGGPLGLAGVTLLASAVGLNSFLTACSTEGRVK